MRREAEEDWGWWREAAVDADGARPGSVTPYDLQPSATNNRTGVL